MKRLCSKLLYKKHMLIEMSQSKNLDPLRSLTLKVKPKRNLKYLPTYLLTTYLRLYLPNPTYPPKYLF
jgi:hypothetical protein